MRDKFIISDVFKLAMTIFKYILSEAINIFTLLSSATHSAKRVNYKGMIIFYKRIAVFHSFITLKCTGR